jgi:pentatricopeptide repeat protein
MFCPSLNTDGLRISMIDIYTEINDLEKLDMMLLRTEQPSRSFFWGLIKAYRKRQQPERAEGVVRSMIENPHHHNPDIGLINGLISAWADAAGTHPQAAEHAFNVYRWLVDDPDVERLNLQPTVVTYSTLLKCLALSGSSAEDIRQKIAVLAKDMENRFKMGNTSCQPDETFYNLVIKAFLRANSPKEAEAILQRMEQQFESESCDDVTVRPSIRTYSEFLMFYSRLGTVSAAERTTQIHDQLRKLSQTTDPSLKPNVYTYNMVLNGWASTNDASTGDHIWKIYEQMVKVDQVELNKYNYTTLLTFYSKSKRLQDVQRAIHLLQAMQNSCDSDMHPQVKHYDMVLWICRNTGALKQAAEVLVSFMEAYTSGKCRMDDKKPSSRFYTWVFTNLLQSDDLVGATRFVLDTLAVTKDKKVLSDFGLVPVFVLQLRQEWTDSDNVDKEKYIDQLDSEVLPVLR